MNKQLLRAPALLALAGVVSCSADVTPAAPAFSPSAAHAIAASGAEEVAEVSPVLGELNTQLAAAGSNLRITKAELLYKADGMNAETSTLILANDRYRGIGTEWVPGDPRRDGRVGVTYAARATQRFTPFTRDGGADAPISGAQIRTQIEEAMQAWRSDGCSAPIVRNEIAAGTDPDLVDQLVTTGAPSANWVQPADIVQVGFISPLFFRIIGGGPAGDGILGVTFTLNFVDGEGNLTDIDHNGKGDAGIAEIYYNPLYYWTAIGRPGSIDFYSVMTHETGHALGLGHFGKLFVTKKAAADGVSIADIKYAPYAIMNAAYVTGRNEIAGTDHSSFCQIWSAAK